MAQGKFGSNGTMRIGKIANVKCLVLGNYLLC